MKDLVKAIKVTNYERTGVLCGLLKGDNLDINGSREIVDYLEFYRGVHAITTIKVDSRLRDLYIKQRYLASAEMLQNGELISIRNGGISDFDVSDSEKDFYEICLVGKPLEVIA